MLAAHRRESSSTHRTEVDLRHKARYDNPFAQVNFDSQLYEISDDDGSLTLDFDARTRSVN